jgi:hypothetical protein
MEWKELVDAARVLHRLDVCLYFCLVSSRQARRGLKRVHLVSRWSAGAAGTSAV